MPKLDKEGEFNSTLLAKGVYASLVTIIEVIDMSNHPDYDRPDNLRNDNTPLDLCIDVKYERDDGVEWSTRFWGDYKSDRVTGKITGWVAFRNGVQSFFETLLGELGAVEELITERYAITQKLLDAVKGMKFYRISYISGMKDTGKGRYKDWNKIFLADTTIEEMQEAWAKVAIRFKTYTPDVIDEISKARDDITGDTSFPHGANVEVKESKEEKKEEEEFEL